MSSRRYGIQTGVPEFPLTADDKDFQKLLPVYRGLVSLAQQTSDATGLTVIPLEEVQNAKPQAEYLLDRLGKLAFLAGETISVGQLIHIDATTPESKIWKANNTAGSIKAAHGVCIEAGGIASGTRGRVLLFRALLVGLSGVTPGSIYWVGTAGQFTPVMPGGGNLQQKVGLGISTSAIAVNISL